MNVKEVKGSLNLDAGKRSESIDFLRGIAVIMVLCSHHWFFTPINEMGWVGVDLFFVLSGFLVSGLLFTEYQKFGNIRPKLFLIRRGFKIYPLFYFSIFCTVILLVFFPSSYLFPDSKILFLNRNGIIIGTIIECLFLQSFFFGFWGHHWSLSVEEFFYFLLALLIWKLSSKQLLQNKKLFYRITWIILSGCLLLRILANIFIPHWFSNYTAAPFRLDSLFAGVFISYNYYFNFYKLQETYKKYRFWMMLLIIPLISYTPFISVLKSPFIKTFGFTLIYISFTFLLLIFLFERNMVQNLQKIIGKILFKAIIKVGFYSYSIYLFHMYIIRFLVGERYAERKYADGEYTYGNVLISFGLYFIGSILLGIFLSKLMEMPTLRLRDKYFPKRRLE